MAPRKHTLDESYFETIDTPEKAYWLGFIAADGCIQQRRDKYGMWPTHLHIGLEAGDASHLEKFRAAVSNGEIVTRIRKKGTESYLNVSGKRFVSGLINQGILPNKTFNIAPWMGDGTLIRDYWRGFFDGDGCITSSARDGRTEWSAELIGTLVMCAAFAHYIHESTGFWATTHPDKTPGMFRVRYGGVRPLRAVLSLLYHQGDTALDRKAELARTVANLIPMTNTITGFTNHEIIGLFHELGSWVNVATHLGVSNHCMYRYLHTNGIPLKPAA